MSLFFSILMKALSVLPAAVAGVEAIATAAHSGAAKKDMAHAAVVMSAGIADVFLDPEQKQLSAAVSSAVGQAIDLTVSTANSIGEFSHKALTPAASADVVKVAPVLDAPAVVVPALAPSGAEALAASVPA